MAAIPVTFVGMDEKGDQKTLVGLLSYTGLGVGGGPVMPPPKPEHPIVIPPGEPPTWPADGHPEHPIYIPPTIWPNPPEGQAPHPEHPIVIPPPPELPGAPPLEVRTVWTPETGWAVVLVPTGPTPTPSSRRR